MTYKCQAAGWMLPNIEHFLCAQIVTTYLFLSSLYSQATPADLNSFIKVFYECFAPILRKFKEIGAPDYLLQFMDPRVVTENTMRRGIVPVSDENNWI